MKRKIIFALILFPLLGANSFGQSFHSRWSGSPVINTNSLIISTIGCMLPRDLYFYHEPDYKYLQWIYPTTKLSFHIPDWQMENNLLEGPDWWKYLLLGDYKHDYNLSVGYKVSYQSLDIPFGAYFGFNYEWRGLCISEGELQGLHRTSGIVPQIGITWRILGINFETVNLGCNVWVEGGASYVNHLSYNSPNSLSTDMINDGIRGHIAVGLRYNVIYYSLEYEWDCYNYFNLPNTKTKLSNINASIGIMW